MKPAAIARQTGVSYGSVYGLTRAAERGFESRTDYETDLARKRGFESYYDYTEHLAAERTARIENRIVVDLVRRSVAKFGKNQSWLARELGVSRQTVSLYAHGKSVPREERLAKLLDVAGASESVRRDLAALLD